MAKLANRAKMTISSTGTGNITLASSVAGYQSFLDAGVSDGDQIRYIIEDNSGADWEIGTAAVSNNSTVLVRTVEESSAANNAALNLTSSAKVFIGVTAKDLDNAAPIFTTTPPTEDIELATDGSTAVTLNAKAYDESGIPVSYSWDAWATGGTTIYDSSALPPQLASAPSINQSSGVYSLVGSSNTSNAGTLNFRVKVSDGVKVATHVSPLILQFSDNFTVSSLSRDGDTLAASSTGLFSATTNGGFISTSGFLVGDAIKTGKYYFEAKYTQAHTLTNSGLFTGLIDAVRGANNDTGYSTTPGGNVAVWFKQDGSVGHNGPYDNEAGFSDSGKWTSGVCTTGNSVTTADILMYAFDTTAKKAWFGINNNWSLFTGNPVTGAGMPMSDITGAVRFFVAYNNVAGSIGLQIQTGSPSRAATYSPPTGFNAY